MSHSGRAQRRSLIPPRREVYYSSHPSASTARFDFIVTMFVVGKIDKDTVNCPWFCRKDRRRYRQLSAIWRKESTATATNLTRKKHNKPSAKVGAILLESPIGFTFTWNRPLCAVLMLLRVLQQCFYPVNALEKPAQLWRTQIDDAWWLTASIFFMVFNSGCRGRGGQWWWHKWAGVWALLDGSTGHSHPAVQTSMPLLNVWWVGCVCVCVCVCVKERQKIELTVWGEKVPIALDGIRTCISGIRTHSASDCTTTAGTSRVSRMKYFRHSPVSSIAKQSCMKDSNSYLRDRDAKHLQGPPLSRTKRVRERRKIEPTVCVGACLCRRSTDDTLQVETQSATVCSHVCLHACVSCWISLLACLWSVAPVWRSTSSALKPPFFSGVCCPDVFPFVKPISFSLLLFSGNFAILCQHVSFLSTA